MAESDWLNVQRNKNTGQYRTKQGGGGGASSMSDLDDTEITNPSNGDTLKYNSTSQEWENKEDSLANLSDVSMLSFSDKQVLSYNGRTQKWENRSNSVSRLSDVSLNSPSDGDILRYNAQSGEWENTVMPDTYHVYSTTEQVVGTWTDGKPLYEKTISKTVNCGSEYDMITRDGSASGLPSTAVPRFVMGGYFDGGVPLSHYDSSNYRTYTMWHSNNIRGYVKWGTLSTTTIRVTIQYTKTTD